MVFYELVKSLADCTKVNKIGIILKLFYDILKARRRGKKQDAPSMSIPFILYNFKL